MKLLRRLAIIALCLAASACSDGDREKYVIGCSQPANDSWREVMNKEMLQEVMLSDNIELKIKSAEGSNEQQVRDIEEFVREGVDLLVVAPIEAEPIKKAVEQVCESGIPVIVADRKVNTDKITAFIGADNYQIGKSVGLWVARYLPPDANVVEITGLMGSSPASERHEGFLSTIGSNHKLNLLCSRDAGWTKDGAYDEMLKVLNEYDDIDLVFAHNDMMAYGAYLAAKSLGLEKEISFVGIDALLGPEGGTTLVSDGILSASFIYPTGGDKVIQLAQDILEGRSFSPSTTLTTTIVDKSNAQLMLMQTNHIYEQADKIIAVSKRLGSLSNSYFRQQAFLYTALAVLLLILILCVFLTLLSRQKNSLNKQLLIQNETLNGQKQQLQDQRDQLIEMSRRLEDATQDKLNFFTNISHEFKTPLTLIQDPVVQLLRTGGLSQDQRYLLSCIESNVDILKELVTQILDFRKYNAGKQELHLRKVDLSASVRHWYGSFEQLSRSKHIRLLADAVPSTPVYIAGDSYKLERIFYNLVSNALKFTPENGTVRISLVLSEDLSSCVLTVHNTGSYIPDDKKEMIFKHLYTSDTVNGGTGIGLSIVQAFVGMHNGEISVQSSRKSGTSFIVTLPVGNPDSLADVSEEGESEIQGGSAPLQLEDDGVDMDVIQDEYRQSILIIDDNESIRTYLKRLLKESFYVIEAGDGAEGVRKAMRYIPNIIISDVMMPVMDGFECCKRLKNEVTTCHIPFILLTAYSMDENRIDGYSVGADSYISKPFSSDVLLARIRNLLENRVRIKTGSDEILTLKNEKVEDMDRSFMSRFKEVIDSQMENSDLSVDNISEALGMSRVQLYRKVKMLTNYSPVEYLRARRLKKAQKLLLTSDLTISEVCYETGFTSPSYFSKCFKDYYNCLPSEYVKRDRQQK